ncbi:MAG: 2-hydroxyacyl-CoA dehydratase [Dehalococcoidia bacterium]|nr:2-hydroxyacyl-CoA dehydratase [Dehalococcoidia bacterium]
MLEEFREQFNQRHQYSLDWKARNNSQVIGYLCTYFPEEIIYAAGLLPVRLLGGHEPQDVAERHIPTMFCPFSRDVLAQGLLGRYNYLDGLVDAFTCVHMRNVFGSWTLNIPLKYQYYLFTPVNVRNPRAKTYWAIQLGKFQKSLEEFTGHPISEAALDSAIQVYNHSRNLLRQIYEMRKSEAPPVTGAECMEMVVSSQVMDKQEHNQLLEKALVELNSRKDNRQTGVRLMLIGSENDDTEFVRMIESLGSTVVIDDHCTGSRYFWNEIIPGKDRLLAISSRYMDRPPCPQKDVEDIRFRFLHIKQLAQDYNVQGAILVQQKFCSPHELDFPALKAFLQEEMNIPSLFLEVDVTIPLGQFRTRVEAFLEMLQLQLV